jgi:transcriptional regulator with XRE-family HTH domain
MLKQARKQRRMTLKQVAAKAGISAFAVFALENDPKDPALRTVFKLANFYGIPLDKLAAVLFPGDAVKDAK